ncbi:Zinc finger protein 292 [Takifugu flavidus]|uniref:Zinc finger protein 292 n=1 Tax=Takifugu flavidus TaxID=433684 RepID=A0A5C6N9X1_9TELE|nr:Zinc finger protein 292 [Takifugu flavidus]
MPFPPPFLAPYSLVDGFISSELPVLFELRVRYLLSCERVSEAMALAKCCAWHPTAGQHLFFLQVYLSWLLKTSQHDILHKEVAGLDGKDAVYIICSLEYEEQDELLLALSRVFLSQQLCRGDMHCLCDLVLIWSTFHHRLKTPKKVLLDEIHLLMQSATNVNSIFPFIKAVLQEAGDDGIQFCVELCANGLQSCLPCDIITKSLIYKTIASLLPNDLEVCRACALLVFFLERTVEAYKTAYLLYMHPDQDYHVDHSPIRNHIRFEMLQVLKKDLHFDPEFWNLIALRTNCLKLLSEKVVSSALEEIMEDKWILNYCSKETAPASSKPRCQKGNRGARSTQRRYRTGDRLKEDLAIPSKRLRLGPGKTLFNVDRTVKRKNTQASRTVKGRTAEPLRRSFWQLDGLKDSRGYEDRRITRLSEKNPPKRRIRTPKWLLEDSGTLEKNKSRKKIKKHGLKHQKNLEVSTEKSSEAIQIKNNAKHKPNTNCESLTREASGKHQKGSSADSLRPASPQVILELSLPDNELFGTFSEDTCNRQRGLPQVLFYKPTMKRPTTSQPVKTVHRKEVILRTRDLTMFVQQLHCYTRRLKGKGTGTSVQGSVSKITRSSVQGMPSKGTEKNGSSDATLEDKDVFVSPPPKAEEAEECSVLEKAQTIEAGSPKSGTEPFKNRGADDLQSESQVLDVSTDHILQTNTSKHREFATQLKVASALQRAAEDKLTEAPALEKGRHGQTKEPCDVSAVEMKVTFASQTPTAGKLLESSVLDKVSKIPPSADVSAVGRSPVEDNPVISSTAGAISMHALTQSSVLKNERRPEPSPLPSQISLGCPETATKVNNSISSTVTSAKLSDGQSASTTDASAPDKGSTVTPPGSDSINDMSDFTEMVSKQPPPDISGDFIHEKRPNFLHKSHNSFSCSFPEQRISAVDDTQEKNEDSDDFDAESSMNTEPVESEESRLEFCCTFCKKVFNGSRVVAHAMFHFRKDECMFCGTMFKDDLLAMMHLSDHIEKLKKSKEFAGNKVQEKQLCDTKDDPTSNSPAKANTNSSGSRCRGRPRKCAIGPKQMSLRESGTQGTRKLRSSIETPVAPCGQGKQANELKNLNMRTPGPKINGNVAKNTVLERLKMVILNSKAKQPRSQKEKRYLSSSSRLSKSKRPTVESTHLNLVAAQMAEEGNVKDVDEQAENKDSTHKLCHELLLNDASGEQTEKITGEKSQKLRFTKKRSNKNKQTVSESKKNNERKTHSHLSNPKTKLGSKACSKSVKSSGVHHDEDKAEEEDGTKPAAFNPGSDSCGTSLTALPANSLNEGVPLAPARDENRKEETTLETSESCVKTSDSTDVGEKHNVPDGGGAQAATDTAHGAQEMVSERSQVEGGTLSSPVLESGAKSRSYSVKINGQVAPGNSSVCIETLAEYGKKPYKRLPPTAYLDERYTTMPKRRKEMTFSPSSERIPVKEEVGAPLQRQRCANCFVTFSSTDELQAHLQLQKCSNLFGFDSDDEGES